MDIISRDLEYILIFLVVLILPKILLRFKVPSGITALSLGIVFSLLDVDLKNNELLKFLSQIGITSLFLFAGLEVEIDELRSERKYLSKYLLKYSIVLISIAGTFYFLSGATFKASFLLLLGLMTPSAGFIISSLSAKNVHVDQEYWIKSIAISKEVVSIVFLFLILQFGGESNIWVSLSFIAFMLFVLPKIFSLFFRFISPYAPNSEVSFLVAFALALGVIAKEIGMYYLIGAFIVGITASRLKGEIFQKQEKEAQLLQSLSHFFVLFLPFYFFYSGLNINLRIFDFQSILYALIFFIFFIPLRLFLIKNEFKSKSFTIDFVRTISISLMPTLIFGIVIVGRPQTHVQVNVSYLARLLFHS